MSLGKLEDYDITKDMPFSLVISTMRRKRLMTLLMSKEREKESGLSLIDVYTKHLNKIRGEKFEKMKTSGGMLLLFF